MTQKIGFCCKWIDPNPPSDKKSAAAVTASFNQKSTTLTHLRSLTQAEQFSKCLGIVQHNLDTLWRQLTWISTQPLHMRLFRITSGFLPASTLEEFSHYLDSEELNKLLSEQLYGVRGFADQHDIRLCMHPGQFTNLCSPDTDVVKRAIEDIEYHTKLARFMGYGETWHSSGFAINIHANANQDPGLFQIRQVIANDLSMEAKNLITLENDEFSCSVDQFVNAGVHEDVALILDIHHHLIQSGQYIHPNDSRAELFFNSWRGTRPLMHYSCPSRDIIGHLVDENSLPDINNLVANGIPKTKLRSHSNLMWNNESNKWAATFIPFADIEIEAKGKNLASFGFYENIKHLVSWM